MSIAEDKARDRARQDVVIHVNKRAIKVSSCFTSLPIVINIWSGYDQSRTRTIEDRDQCGREAVDMLTEAVAQLAEARDLLAAAVQAADDAA